MLASPYLWVAALMRRREMNAPTNAEAKIIQQVQKDGCLPARSDWRTIKNLQDSGKLYFDDKRGCYRVNTQSE
jgi:hypothetical protein